MSRAIGTSRHAVVRTMGSGLARALVVPATSFVVLPLVLAELGTVRYGVWATLSSLLAIAGLVDAGVRTEIIRRVADAHGSGDLRSGVRAARQGATILAGGAVLIAGLVSIFNAQIVRFTFPDIGGDLEAETRAILVLLSVLLSVSVVNGGLFSVAAGLQRADFENVTILVSGLASAIVTVVGVRVLGLGLWGMAWGAVAGVAVLVAGQIWATRRVAPDLRWPFTTVGRRTITSFFAVSTLLFVSQLGDVVDFQYDKIILSRYIGADAAGQYQLGTMLSLQLRLLALLPMTILLAGVAELWRQSPARATRLLQAVTAFVYGAGGLLMTGVIVLAPAFMQLWLGDGYDEAGRAAQLLAVAMAVNLVAAPWTSYAIGRRWVDIPALSATGNMVTNAAVSFALVRAIGFDGALYGSIAGNVVGLMVFYGLLRHRARASWLFPVVRPLVVCVVVGVGSAELVARWPGATSSWPGLLSTALVLATVLVVALFAIAPHAMRDEARKVLARRGSARH